MCSPITLEALQTRIRQGETFTYRRFYGHTPRTDGKPSNAVFSQFYARPFEIQGQIYQWAEQWMMANKALLFGDEEALQRIRLAADPQECKEIGRQVRQYDDIHWSAIRYAVVLAGTLAKFRQNRDLRDYLVSTGDEILVEAAANDTVWGIGLHRDHPSIGDALNWRGLNLLGFALTHARAVITGNLPEPGTDELPVPGLQQAFIRTKPERF